MTFSLFIDLIFNPSETFNINYRTHLSSHLCFEVLTDVRSELGTASCCLSPTCCLLGSCCVSWLVCRLPGFRRFNHFCPCCGARLGEGNARFTSTDIALFFCLILLAFGRIGAILGWLFWEFSKIDF